jgi:hypothetical protein
MQYLLDESTENHLGVLDSNLDFRPAEVLGPHVGCTLPRSDLHQLLVVVVEEVGIVGVVGQEDENDDCYADREYTLRKVSPDAMRQRLVTDLNDVDPSPAR